MRTMSQMWKEILYGMPAYNADVTMHIQLIKEVERSVTRSSNMLYDSRRAPSIYTLDFILKHINFWLSQESTVTPFYRRQRKVDEL